jgi:glycerol-3-phosphate O-acyltransferase/dihydroxyacetone phosphate acyltransferase
VRLLLLALCRLVVRIFFRRVEVVGEARLPEGGILLAPNHPNALMDPLVLLTQSRRPVSFLAKAPLFRTFLVSIFVKAFEALPVYRAQDGFETSKNKETLTAAAAVLARGGAIAIFPEGRSHDEPKLGRLKTGGARIALGGRALGPPDAPVHIVPCGIVYLDKRTFRSDVVLVYGGAIPVPRIALDDDGEPPREPTEELTEKIREGLDALVVQAEDHELLELSALASSLVRGARRDRGERHSLPGLGASESSGDVERERRLRRAVVETHERLAGSRGPEIASLIERMRGLEALFTHYGLDVDATVRALPALRALLALFALFVFAPLGIAGAAVHYPVYRLVGHVARRMAKGEDVNVATLKMLGGLLFYPIFWLIAAGAALFVSLPLALALLVALPVSAFVALRTFEALPHVATWLRVISLGNDARVLAAERDAIYEELLALYEKTDPSPSTPPAV